MTFRAMLSSNQHLLVLLSTTAVLAILQVLTHRPIFIVNGAVTAKPKNTVAKVGDNVTLICETNLTKPVLWRFRRSVGDDYISIFIDGRIADKDSKFLVPRTTSFSYSLVIPRVSLEDAALYTCIDGNDEHASYLGYEVQLVIIDEVLNCSTSPNIRIVNIIAGDICGLYQQPDTINLLCFLPFSGSVAPSIHCSQGDNDLIPSATSHATGHMQNSTKYSFVLSSKILDGSSEFICKARHLFYNGMSDSQETLPSWHSGALKILYLSNSISSRQVPCSQFVMEYRCLETNLDCHFKWWKNDIELNVISNSLTLVNKDNENGTYLCNANCSVRGRSCARTIEHRIEVICTSPLTEHPHLHDLKVLWIVLGLALGVLVVIVIVRIGRRYHYRVKNLPESIGVLNMPPETEAVAAHGIDLPCEKSHRFDDEAIQINSDSHPKFVSGMTMIWCMYKKQWKILSGLIVTYSNSRKVLHHLCNVDGNDVERDIHDQVTRICKQEKYEEKKESPIVEQDAAKESQASEVKAIYIGKDTFKLEEPDERITGILVRSGYFIDSLTFTTNKKKIYGPFGTVSGTERRLSAPDNKSYLSYITGTVDETTGTGIKSSGTSDQTEKKVGSIRNLIFNWACNKPQRQVTASKDTVSSDIDQATVNGAITKTCEKSAAGVITGVAYLEKKIYVIRWSSYILEVYSVFPNHQAALEKPSSSFQLVNRIALTLPKGAKFHISAIDMASCTVNKCLYFYNTSCTDCSTLTSRAILRMMIDNQGKVKECLTLDGKYAGTMSVTMQGAVLLAGVEPMRLELYHALDTRVALKLQYKILLPDEVGEPRHAVRALSGKFIVFSKCIAGGFMACVMDLANKVFLLEVELKANSLTDGAEAFSMKYAAALESNDVEIKDVTEANGQKKEETVKYTTTDSRNVVVVGSASFRRRKKIGENDDIGGGEGHAAVDQDNRVFIADPVNRQLLLLDSKFSNVMVVRQGCDNDDICPSRLCYSLEEDGRLIVGHDQRGALEVFHFPREKSKPHGHKKILIDTCFCG